MSLEPKFARVVEIDRLVRASGNVCQAFDAASEIRWMTLTDS